MTGLLFACTFEATEVSAVVDLFEINVQDDRPVIIPGLYLSQSSDVGDAAEEFLRVQIVRVEGGAAGSGGSGGGTARCLNALNTTSGFNFETCNTTPVSGGTDRVLWSGTFNVRLGLQYIPLPDMRPGNPFGSTFDRLVVRLVAAPADVLTMSGTLIVEEALQ